MSDGISNDACREERDYYKRLVDELAAQVMTLDYRAWGATERLSDLRKAFSLIAELQSDGASMVDGSVLRKKLVVAIAQRMRLDCVVVLEPGSNAFQFQPVAWSGLPSARCERIGQACIELPTDFLQAKKTLLVNSKTSDDPLITALRSFLALPYFICIPIEAAERVHAVLIVGRERERLPDYPQFDESDVDTYEAIAGLLRTAHLYQRELMRQLEFERERVRIAGDMHDEIGSSLTKIVIASELALKTELPDETKSLLDRITRTSREVIDSIGNIIWAINPRNDRLDNLAGYMREFASDFFELSAVRCHFVFPDALPDVPFSAETRRNIFLVFKEALNNVLKHANASEVSIRLLVSEQHIEFIVEDNGVGFTSCERRTFGNGLLNMGKRMESIGGVCEIMSRQQGGTKVVIGMPV